MLLRNVSEVTTGGGGAYGSAPLCIPALARTAENAEAVGGEAGREALLCAVDAPAAIAVEGVGDALLLLLPLADGGCDDVSAKDNALVRLPMMPPGVGVCDGDSKDDVSAEPNDVPRDEPADQGDVNGLRCLCDASALEASDRGDPPGVSLGVPLGVKPSVRGVLDSRDCSDSRGRLDDTELLSVVAMLAALSLLPTSGGDAALPCCFPLT